LAEAIKAQLDLECELKESRGGVFEVTFGETLIFSKKKENRFPEHDEVIQGLKKIIRN
jgi:selT/selW/selH-like putative selenoprotein